MTDDDIKRLTHSRKLTPKEIRYFIPGTGLKRGEVAAALSVEPEHLSRVIAGTRTLGGAAEKLFRIMVALKKQEPVLALSTVSKIIDLRLCPAELVIDGEE